MNGWMALRLIASSLVLLVSAMPGPGVAAACGAAACVESVEVDGKAVKEAVGVLVRLADDPKERKVTARPGLELAEGATVEAPSRPRTRVGLVTRNGNRITLQPGSRLRIDVAGDRGERFSHLLGETRFAVTKALSFFEVAHEKFLAAVKGTEFTVGLDEGRDEIRYGWVRGEVVVEHEVIVSVTRGGGRKGARDDPKDDDDDDAEETTYVEREVLSEAKPELRYRLNPREYLKIFKTFRDAEQYFREQLARDEQTGDPRQIQLGLMNLGTILERIGKPKAALEVLARGLELARTNGNELQEAHVARRLGFTYRELNDFPKSVAMHRRWLEIMERRGAARSLAVARAYTALGRTAGQAGDPRAWVQSVERAMAIHRRLDPDEERMATAAGYKNLGDAQWAAGDRKQALQSYAASLEIKRKLAPERGSAALANTLRDLGMRYVELQDHAKAADYLQRALRMRIAVLGEPSPPVATSLEDLGIASTAAGNTAQAFEWLGKALAMRQQLYPDGAHRSIVRTYRVMAITAQVAGDSAGQAKYEALAREMEGRLEK